MQLTLEEYLEDETKTHKPNIPGRRGKQVQRPQTRKTLCVQELERMVLLKHRKQEEKNSLGQGQIM